MKTIAAISTAAAPGGIGVIRISGDEARAVGDRVFKSFSGAKLCDMAPKPSQKTAFRAN